VVPRGRVFSRSAVRGTLQDAGDGLLVRGARPVRRQPVSGRRDGGSADPRGHARREFLVSNSASDNWRPTDHGLPEDFVPPPGVRYLVHGNVLTILDDRGGNTGP